jgi:hypothetical protein
MRHGRIQLGFLFLGLFALLGAPALAGESPFGWVYTAEVMPTGRFEFEHQSFLQHGQAQGSYDYLIHREELEYGVTSRFQLAGYFNWSQVNAYRNGVDGLTSGPGVDLGPADDDRARYRTTRFKTVSLEAIYQLRNPLSDRYGLALYIEPELGPRERALEWRVIFQKNFLDDRVIMVGNILGAHERETEADGEIERLSMVDLTAAVSYRMADRWSVGIETRNHREFLGTFYDSREHSAWFLGPNVHYAAQRWWLTAAWRTQLPVVQTFSQDQADVTVGRRIYGAEHARDEFMLKIGVPF